MADAAVEIVPYDTSWPQRFLDEKLLLEEALAPWLIGDIEHIGSTAIPNLAAKPIIDIMAPVQSLESSHPAIETVQRLGDCYAPYKIEVMHWFCKPNPAYRTHHLHLIPLDSQLWRQRLRFRDTLRNDPALAHEYAVLKHSLAAKFKNDREAYTDNKTEFISKVLAH